MEIQTWSGAGEWGAGEMEGRMVAIERKRGTKTKLKEDRSCVRVEVGGRPGLPVPNTN